MGNTKRNFERYTPTGMAVWIREKGAAEDSALQVNIQNICAGGAKCMSPVLYGNGTLLHVDFELPQFSEIIQVSAIVRHVDCEEDGYALTGLEFLEVHNLDRDTLFKYLTEVLK
ncbi:MAG: hypothetical protein CSA81_11985 [Acidobacteria bacterium]|nr:MAG: hypothetical protein CSA81_11985 [Acidobacteriota bacterium]